MFWFHTKSNVLCLCLLSWWRLNRDVLLRLHLNLSPDYRYPYTALRSSGPAPTFPLQAEGSRRPTVEEASSPTASQFPSAVASSPRYEPGGVVVTSGSGEPSRAPQAAPQYMWSPVASGKRTPGVSVGDASGTSSMGPAPPYAAYRGVPASYGAAPSSFGEVGRPSADAAFYMAGAGPLRSLSVSGLPVWIPWDFPDVGAWEAVGAEPQSVSETSPLPPSSYIIQSRNGYLRAREVLSHSKYSPDYYGPPSYPFKAAGDSSWSPAGPGAHKGQQV